MVYASDDEKRVYFGGSDTTFEEQYRNHTHNFNHDRYSKCRVLKVHLTVKKKSK